MYPDNENVINITPEIRDLTLNIKEVKRKEELTKMGASKNFFTKLREGESYFNITTSEWCLFAPSEYIHKRR